jgi:hypothetical protein
MLVMVAAFFLRMPMTIDELVEQCGKEIDQPLYPSHSNAVVTQMFTLCKKCPERSKRTPALANWPKAEGMKPGVLDLLLPVGRGGYYGLFIEMKRRIAVPSDVSKDQRDLDSAPAGASFPCRDHPLTRL